MPVNGHGGSTHVRRSIIILVLLVAIGVVACDGEGADITITTTTGNGEAPDTTEAPATTQPPEETTTTQPPTDGGDSGTDTTTPDEGAEEETPWWILILVGLGILVIIVMLVRRGSRQTPTAPTPLTWKDHARRGYAEARWLYDAMSEDVAVWRGNARFDGTTDLDASAGTSRAETWASMSTRLGAASDELYALEAMAPDGRTADAARSTISTMRRTREALDARAEARHAYRVAESEHAPDADLREARDREVRASRNLAEARTAYAGALRDLSTLV